MARFDDRLAALVTRQAMRLLVAAFELPDETHRCPGCKGEGYVRVEGSNNEVVCAACGGTGLRERSGGDGA